MYAEVKEEVAAGGRAFIIYPLIEESSTERFVDVKAAEEEYAKLRDSMKLGQGVECSLLHGRMAADEKQAAVARFSSGETPVLVSTSVVEVRPPSCCRPQNPPIRTQHTELRVGRAAFARSKKDVGLVLQWCRSAHGTGCRWAWTCRRPAS